MCVNVMYFPVCPSQSRSPCKRTAGLGVCWRYKQRRSPGSRPPQRCMGGPGLLDPLAQVVTLPLPSCIERAHIPATHVSPLSKRMVELLTGSRTSNADSRGRGVSTVGSRTRLIRTQEFIPLPGSKPTSADSVLLLSRFETVHSTALCVCMCVCVCIYVCLHILFVCLWVYECATKMHPDACCTHLHLLLLAVSAKEGAKGEGKEWRSNCQKPGTLVTFSRALWMIL